MLFISRCAIWYRAKFRLLILHICRTELTARKLLINYTQQSSQTFSREYGVISHECQVHTLLLRKKAFATSQIEGCINKRNLIQQQRNSLNSDQSIYEMTIISNFVFGYNMEKIKGKKAKIMFNILPVENFLRIK